MSNYLCILFCVLLALSITDPITAKRTFVGGSHSYPKSGGLSGNSPSRPGLSGGAGYPSYTHSTGHYYPTGNGIPGTSNTGHITNVHHYYNYNPPQQIRYTPVHGGAPVSYPVYQGSPPTYVYKYKDSGSKYGTLLAGLALLNLGTISVSPYALSYSHSNYKPVPGEVCKFGVKKDNGDYEETKIDCILITGFIFQEQLKTNQNSGINTITTTIAVTIVTTVNMPGSAPVDVASNSTNTNPLYEMLPNGTLVPINATAVNSTTNVTNETLSPSTNMTSSVTTVTTTVTNAVDVKGEPIKVTPGMQCYVIRHAPSSNMKRSLPCGLLQIYAEKILEKNSATGNTPAFTILTVFFVFIAVV